MKPRRKIRNYTGDPEFMFTRRFNTPLLGRKKKEFKEWANTPGEDGRLPINDMGAYDMQGYWKEYISKGVNPNDEDNHGPDTFKKPNHPSFSDESKHSSRRWPGGQWQEDGGFRAAKHTRHLYGKNLKRYFEEEGRPEYLIEEKDGGGDVRSHNRKENVVHPFLKEKIEKEYAAKKQLAYERALTGELGAEADFRDAYGVPSHTMRPKSNAPVRKGQGTIDYPKNDMRNKNFVNPLMTYASGHIKDPQLKKAMDKIQLAPIEMALPIPLVNQMGKIPSGLKVAKSLVKQAGEYATTKTLLKNAHKLNPYAFKPKEEMMYRGIGKEGKKDALKSGVFRANPNPRRAEFEVDGKRFNLTKTFNKAYYTPKFNIADRYGKGYIAEVPKSSAEFKKRYGLIDEWSFHTEKQIPIEEGKILKSHWLKGYEEIAKSKSKKFNKGFKSEIDWAKWNKEIPNNAPLMKEYKAIEQQAKSNGTWMKNPDGTNFTGTPEQFVQQNSENFKKAFPEGFNEVYRGANNNAFLDKDGRSVFTGNKSLAKEYAVHRANFINPNAEGAAESSGRNLFNLAHKKSNNSLTFDANNRNWTNVSLRNPEVDREHLSNNIKRLTKELETLKNNYATAKQASDGSWIMEGSATRMSDYLYKQGTKSQEEFLNLAKDRLRNIENLVDNPKLLEKMRIELGDVVTTDDIAKYIENNQIDFIKLNAVDDGGMGNVTIVNHKKGNYLKSLIGNDGMFDMTNPNIYKGLIPPAAIIGASKLQGQDDNTQHMKTKKLRTGGTALLLPRIRAKRQTGGFVFDDMPEGDPPVGMPILPISNKAKAIAEEIYDPGSPSTTLAPEEDPFINAPPPMVAGQKNRKLKRQWDRYRKLVKEMPHTKRIQQTDPARGKGDTRFEGGGDVNRKKVDKVKKHWSSATLEELEEIRNPKKYPNFPLVPKDLRGTENPDTAYKLTNNLNKRTLPRLLTTSHMRDVLFPQFQSKGGTRDASPEFKSGINELIDEKSKSKSTRRMRIGQAPYQEGESIPREFGGYSMDMSDNLTMFPSDLVDYYGLGGWLKKNVGNVLKTAAGVGSMFIPGMQGVGAGMIAGGVGGMVSGEQEAEETAEVYRPPVAKANQVYDVPMEMGGNLKQATKRTDYQGPSHEGGGIPLGETGVEVEGEESRTGDMIHSDKIKLTKNMYKRYGGMVPLKKSDIGKSVAQILKKTDKKFEKRSGDKWNDEARKATQEPFEMMSDELSQIYAIAQDGVQEMRGGGKPDFEFVRGTKNNNYQLPEGFHLKDKKNFEMLSDFLSDDGAYEGMSPIRQFEDYRKMIQDGKATGDTTAVHGVLKKLQDWSAKHQDDPMVDKDQYFPPMQKEYGGNTIEAEGGFDLGSFFNKENLAGNMPIIGSAFGAASSMLRKPEKVKYEQARISPTKVTPISTEGGINRIRSTFGNTRERMRRMNPRGYMNTMRDMGAAEAGAIGDYSGQVTAQNTMMQNQASMQDSQAQTRVNMHNSELAAKEAEANAANRGAKRSTTDAYLNNMFTQFGQKSRDDRSYAAQDKYMDMMGKHLEGVRSIYGNNQEGLPGEMPDTPFDINEIYDPWKEKNIGFGNPMSRYGGKLRRLYGGRLRRLNKLAV